MEEMSGNDIDIMVSCSNTSMGVLRTTHDKTFLNICCIRPQEMYREDL